MYSTLGPPQLSTMLSVTEPLDHPFERSLSTHEETVENSITQKSDSLNIQQKKGFSGKKKSPLNSTNFFSLSF
jgi:hypothetical protein